jgi:hypothetical protein
MASACKLPSFVCVPIPPLPIPLFVLPKVSFSLAVTLQVPCPLD